MIDPVTRLTEALSGRYTIERELGAGGMATVYLAADAKHDRNVAIKVLKPELAAVIGGDRFLAEIKTTAALQHPHILPLFDSGEADGFLYYVMPFVDGESLRDKLDREKQLDVDQAVKIAVNVASALHYAHERGIVHRDIKPANILIHAGQPVVADFGIALAISAAGGGRLTETGMSVGTPHYMSPEQASADRDVTSRSDIYALACVLYEMLAGDPPHTGPSAQAVMVRILTEDPREITDVRKSVPSHVRAALTKGLEKLSADRFATADQFGQALEDEQFRYGRADTAQGSAGTAEASAGAASWNSDTRTRLGALAFVGMAVALALNVLTNAPPTMEEAARVLPSYRFVVADETAERASINWAAISSRGAVAYVLTSEDYVITSEDYSQASVWVREAGEVEAKKLDGTTGAAGIAFSPDGGTIVFGVDGELRRMPLGGGGSVVIHRAEEGVVTPHEWGADGRIRFVAQVPGLPNTVAEIGENGGELVVLQESSGTSFLFAPVRLPDNAGWLYTESQFGTGAFTYRLMWLPALGEAPVEVMDEASRAQLIPGGNLAYVHMSGSIFVGPFDAQSGRFMATPVPVLDPVHPFGAFQVSASGTALYTHGFSTQSTSDIGMETVLVDPTTGDAEVLPVPRTDHGDGRFSPDGRYLAYIRSDNVWVFDLELGSNPQLTVQGSDHHDPVWSPDGSQIAFASNRGDDTATDIWVKRADGEGSARLVRAIEAVQYPKDWTDGGTILFQSGTIQNRDLLVMPADGSGEPRSYLSADWTETLPRISPDGKWLAYQSGQVDGEPSIIVRSYPDPGSGFQISAPGTSASNPHWSPDGETLYYQTTGGREPMTIAASLVVTADEISVRERHDVAEGGTLRDVHPDGRLLLFRYAGIRADDFEEVRRLTVAVNWLSDVARVLESGR